MPTGKATTYDLTTGVMLDFEPLIALLDPFDTPLLGQYGADGRSVLTKGNAFEKEVDWQDETLLNPRSLLAINAVTADTYVTVTAGDQLRFSTGDVLLVDSEYLRVTGYGTTADTLTITKGFGGSTSTTHATAAVVVGVGTALAEGSDPENARSADRTKRYNITQVFGPHAIQVSGTENVVRKYGLEGTTEFDHQTANRMKEMAVALEQAILYGQRYEDSTNKLRTMGGFVYYITSNIDSTTTAITDTKILDQAQVAYDAGGNPNLLVVGSKQKRNISATGFITNTTQTRISIGRADNGRGQVVDYFDYDFGRLSVILDRWARPSDAFGFNRDQVELDTLRPMMFEMLAKTGDSVKGQVVCEKTLRFRRQKHSFRFSALT